jgi:hypothetical protein
MKASQSDFDFPTALLEQVEAQAAAENRPVTDILREAVEAYIKQRRSGTPRQSEAVPLRTPQEAAERILENRKHHKLPEGESIRSLMTYGRA